MERYTPPKKNPPKYAFRTMKELRTHADTNKTTIAKIMLPTRCRSRAGRKRRYAFVDKIINAMVATVKSGLSMPEDDVLPGPIKLHSKAATVTSARWTTSFSETGIGTAVGICVGGIRRNGRGHLVITARPAVPPA